MLVFSFLFSVFSSELFLFVFAAARHLVNFSFLQVLSTSLLMLLLIFYNYLSMYMYLRIYEYVLYICTLYIYIYKVFLLILLLLLLLLIVGFPKCFPPPKKKELNRRGLTKFAPAKSKLQ